MRPADLAEVLATFGPDYLAAHALPRGAARVWRAIAACRTAALGGQVEACNCCGATRHVYHSCRNRHCPRCQTRAKEAWLAARRREVLPVPYFHLVFTLPHALNGLVATAPRAVYELLFRAAAATLTEFATSPRHLGGTPAFSLLLHTWKQDLGRHVHVHALVAGGALAGDGAWISPKKGFLFPVKALSRVFRGKFVAGLETWQATGRTPESIAAPAEWRNLKQRLYAHDWVVYAKQPLGGPDAVLEYLGRYTHRVAISNERIVGVAAHEVAFRVRAEAGKKRTIRLPGREFIGRFLLPSAASSCMCCRTASSASAITGSCRRPASKPAWRRPAPPSRCRPRSRRSSKRRPVSCAASRGSNGWRARTAGGGSSWWSSRFHPGHPFAPGPRRPPDMTSSAFSFVPGGRQDGLGPRSSSPPWLPRDAGNNRGNVLPDPDPSPRLEGGSLPRGIHCLCQWFEIPKARLTIPITTA